MFLASRLFKNVVRVQHSSPLSAGLVLHDPKGSHYKIWRGRISDIAKTHLTKAVALGNLLLQDLKKFKLRGKKLIILTR
jgi:hypothetical protein